MPVGKKIPKQNQKQCKREMHNRILTENISCWEIFAKVLPTCQSKNKVAKGAPGLL